MMIRRILSPNDPLFSAYCQMRIALWPDCAEDCRAEAGQLLADAARGAAFIALADNSTPTGFIELSLRDYAESATISPVPFIEGWFVASAHRLQGIGRALVETAEQWAASAGFTEIASDTQLENTASIAAHARLGYQEVERSVAFLKSLPK